MACIGNCPVNAIEYGNVTQEKERYIFKKYRYVIDEKTEE
jgi:ferredoxin